MRIYILLFLLVMPIVTAEINNFPNTIIAKTFNATINVTTEQDSHIFDCMSNSTSTFTFSLQRNLTREEDLRRVVDDLKDTTRLCERVSVLDTAVSQYGDINTYFKLYTQCNTENTICNKEKIDCHAKVVELTSFKSNSEQCSKSLGDANNQLSQFSNIVLPSMQTNLTSMSFNLNQAEKSKWIFFFFGLAVMGAIMIFREKKRSPTLQKHKTLGLSGGIQR